MVAPYAVWTLLALNLVLLHALLCAGRNPQKKAHNDDLAVGMQNYRTSSGPVRIVG